MNLKSWSGPLLAVIVGVGVAWAVGDGKAVFTSKCASCHGKDGKGNPAMAKMFKVDASALDLTDQATQAKKDEDLAGIVSKGVNKMPAFSGKLSETETGDVTAYVRSLGGPAEPSTPAAAAPADLDAAAKNYAAKCASCHGKDGKGNPAMAKVFKADPPALDLTDEATLSKTNEELNGIAAKGVNKMPAFSGKLSDQEIADLTAYLRTLAK